MSRKNKWSISYWMSDAMHLRKNLIVGKWTQLFKGTHKTLLRWNLLIASSLMDMYEAQVMMQYSLKKLTPPNDGIMDPFNGTHNMPVLFFCGNLMRCFPQILIIFVHLPNLYWLTYSNYHTH